MIGTPLETHQGYHVGDVVYFNHPHESWVRGTLTTINCVPRKDGFTEVQYGCVTLSRDFSVGNTASQNNSSSHSALVYPLCDKDLHHIVEMCGEPTAANTVNDLLSLSYLHDVTLLEQVRLRYYENLIYTQIGPIMLALNPYDFTLPNYTDDKMPLYTVEGSSVIEKGSKNLPHAWTVAHYSYWCMRTDGRNQSIIVSGESGAGKTETSKIVIKYIGVVSTSESSHHEKSAVEEIETKVNLTSPILESFGNAKTQKNDNSSRFGKFMKIFFSPSTDGSVMIGSSIKVYLLERSRVVTHSKGERGYHSFYQLLAPSNNAEKLRRLSELHLTRAEDYHCTSVGNATLIDGVSDANEFDSVVQAMQFVGMTAEEIDSVWNTVGAVLHILSLEFNALSEDECCIDMTARDAEVHLRMVKQLLGLPHNRFFAELTTTTQVTRGETIVRQLRREQAFDLRDGVAKTLYEALFLWLVARINELIMPPVTVEPTETLWIGLLDIFGFENFSNGNSFEQLCINLTNETLQNHYNSIIFTRDMEECHREKINTDDVVFYDNRPALDLICGMDFSNRTSGDLSKVTNKLSILDLLNEESALAKGSDLSFCERVCDMYGGRLLDGKGSHPNFRCVKTDRNSFIIRHYASDVVYNVKGFRAKNTDATKDGIKDALRSSTIPFIHSLLDGMPLESGSFKKSTVGTFFRNQLEQLMVEINGTNPHWIRCIKPHSSKKPRMFNGNDVMLQMRSAGVLETVRIRQNSFPVRLPFSDFIRAHKVLSVSFPTSECILDQSLGFDLRRFRAPISDALSDAETALEILRRAGIDSKNSGQVGKTKVFLKKEASQRLSSLVRQMQKKFVLVIQATARQFHSLRGVHAKFLCHHLRVITMTLNSLRSQTVIRRRELRVNEQYLLQKFREFLLLQNYENTQRDKLYQQQNMALLVLLDTVEEDRASIAHILMEKKHQQDAAECDALISAEGKGRHFIECSESAKRYIMDEHIKFNTLEKDTRDEIELDEAMLRKTTIVVAHGKLLDDLEVSFARLKEMEKLKIFETEASGRRVALKQEADSLNTICLLMKLLFSETSSRASLMEGEEVAFDKCYCTWKECTVEIERLWHARKSITDRRELLLLQKEEMDSRRAVQRAYVETLAGIFELLAENHQLSQKREDERLALEAEEQMFLEEEELAKEREKERQRVEAIRGAAQLLWQNMLEDERLAKEIKSIEDHIKSIRAAQTTMTQEYMIFCRRKEIAKGKAGTVVKTAKDMKELEEYRKRQINLAQSLASKQHQLLQAQKRLTLFRSRTGLKSPVQRLPSASEYAGSLEMQEDVSLFTLRDKSVSQEGSINLIHRMNLTRGLAYGKVQESSRVTSTTVISDRLEAYRQARERRKRDASQPMMTPSKGNRNGIRANIPHAIPSDCLSAVHRHPPSLDLRVQHNPFRRDWSPGPPEADGSYWVFTPNGERVSLVSVEQYDPTGIHVMDSDERAYRSSPEPFAPCFNR